MNKKIISFLLTVPMVLSSFCSVSLTALAEEAPGAYDFIANEDFDENYNADCWVSKDLNATLSAVPDILEEENGNKFLRYTRANNATNWYGQPLHDLAFSPKEKASLFGGKNVVIEYKLRSYYTSVPADAKVGNAWYSVRMNNIDRGSAHTPHSFYQKYTLMVFSPVYTAVMKPNGNGAEPVANLGIVGNEWVSFKVEIDADNNKITYYCGDSQPVTVNYFKYFLGMDALETLNFCMAGSAGTAGDYLDVDDVKIYYSNPAPTAAVLSTTAADELVIQFDREIDESKLADGTSTIQLLNGSTPVAAPGEYDAASRQYKISLADVPAGSYTLSYSNIYARNISTNAANGILAGGTEAITVEAPTGVSHDASLKELSFNGYSVLNFAPDKYEYAVEMPAMAEPVLPAIAAVPNNAAATVAVTPTAWKGEKVKITVTAADGYTTKSYYLMVKQCGVADDVQLGSVELTPSSSVVEIPSEGKATLSVSTLIKDTTGAAVTENAGTVEYLVLGNPVDVTVDEKGVISITEWTRPGVYIVEAIVTPSASYPYQSRIGGRTTFEVTGTPNENPRISDVKISGVVELNKELTLEPYTYYQVNGVEEGASLVEWLCSDTMNGEYKVIEGENKKTFKVTQAYENKFIRARVTPVDEDGHEGAPVESNYLVRFAPPVASDVTVSGVQAVGEVWKVSYKFSDLNMDDEGITTFRWLRENASGKYDEIKGAAADTYKITEDDINKKIIAEVTPVSVEKPYAGTPVASEGRLAAARARVSEVGIIKVSDNLVGASYKYSHEIGISEGETRFEWYYGNSLISDEDTLNISDYRGDTITLTVIPVASKAPFEGEKASASYKVPNKTTSYGGGGGGGGGGSRPVVVPSVPKPDNKEENTSKPEAVTGIPAWAKEGVDYVMEKGWMAAENNDFGGDTAIDRREFLTVVLKAVGIEPVEYKNIFGDISADDEFSGLLQAAVDAGIISEYDNFYPDRDLSREEMCKILAQSLKAASGRELPRADISHFADGASIAEWAVDYVSTAVATGLIKGVSDTEFAPKGQLTRAQTAVIAQRMVAYLDSLKTEATGTEAVK